MDTFRSDSLNAFLKIMKSVKTKYIFNFLILI